MLREFCDVCDSEMTDEQMEPIKIRYKEIEVSVRAEWLPQSTDDHAICRECIIEALGRFCQSKRYPISGTP